MSAKGSRVDAGACLGVTTSCVLLASAIFSFVGLTGTWGSASISGVGGLVSGTGDFTLWELTIKTKIEAPIPLAVPDVTVKLDDYLCDQPVELQNVDEVCGRFKAMRSSTAAALLLALVAFVCSSAATSGLFFGCLGRGVAQAVLPLASALAFGCCIGAVVALASAATMPRSELFARVGARPGDGAICMALLVAFSLTAGVLDLVRWNRLRQQALHDRSATTDIVV